MEVEVVKCIYVREHSRSQSQSQPAAGLLTLVSVSLTCLIQSQRSSSESRLMQMHSSTVIAPQPGHPVQRWPCFGCLHSRHV